MILNRLSDPRNIIDSIQLLYSSCRATITTGLGMLYSTACVHVHTLQGYNMLYVYLLEVTKQQTCMSVISKLVT